MLCSMCKKNVAVVFTNKQVDGKNTLEGLCYNCAKEKGINPLDVLSKQAQMSEEDLENMSKQFGDLFGDISKNLNIESMDSENSNNPMSSIFSSILGGEQNISNEEPAVSTNESKKVKVDKKSNSKKKRFLDSYGTNLTVKAKER